MEVKNNGSPTASWTAHMDTAEPKIPTNFAAYGSTLKHYLEPYHGTLTADDRMHGRGLYHLDLTQSA